MIETTEATGSLETPEEMISVSKDDYDQIIEQLEILNAAQNEDTPIVLTKGFWDRCMTKLIVTLLSVKIWILIFILFAPYELVRTGKISGDNYTLILTIVAPIIIGLRELSKGGGQGSSTTSSITTTLTDFLATIKKKVGL